MECISRQWYVLQLHSRVSHTNFQLQVKADVLGLSSEEEEIPPVLQSVG